MIDEEEARTIRQEVIDRAIKKLCMRCAIGMPYRKEWFHYNSCPANPIRKLVGDLNWEGKHCD